MSILDNILKRSPLLAKTPQDLIPYGLLGGKYDYKESGRHEFISDYERENCRADYKSFDYYINELGFRDQVPDVTDQPVMGFFGCSITFGEGLDSSDNFPQQLSNYYGTKCLNLGLPGSSSRRIALIYNAAIRIWPIKLALVTLPNWSRTLFVDEKGFLKNLHLNYKSSDRTREDYARFVNDQHLIYETREAIESIHVNAQLHGVPTIITSWDAVAFDLAKRITNTQPPMYRLWDRSQPYDPDEYARDNSHPGVKLVNRYIQDIKQHIYNNNLL